jgi:hypothetical protein
MALTDDALRLGARLSNNGSRPPATSLVRVEAIFAKWLLFSEWRALHAVLSAVAAHYAGGEGVWLFVVDSPGSGKTEMIRALNGLQTVYPLSSLTPQTFASGKPVKDADKDPSLLLRLPRECIVTLKDFTTLLTMHRDSRQEIMAQLRELADGSFVKEFGNGKTVAWEGRMCFIAGVTPVLDTHWAVNQTLGERFIQVRPTAADPLLVGQRSMANVGREEEMHEELRAVVTEFIGGLNYPQIGELTIPGDLTDCIAALSTFVVRARSAVFRDGYRHDIEYIPTPEGPARLARQLATLVRGRAILDGSACVTEEHFAELVHIGMDCIPQHRRQVVETLIEAELTTTNVAAATGYPTASARRTLEDLAAVGVVTRHAARSEGTGADSWSLSDDARDWHSRFAYPKSQLEGV